jgi:DNA-nicking Smr family endonuclease
MSTDGILTDDDLQTWQYVSRTVTPLPGREIILEPWEEEIIATPENKPSQEELEKLVASRDSKPKTKAELPYIKHSETTGVDKATAKRLKSGKFPVEARLDMHGRTQDEALDGLRYFIRAAFEMDKRCVMVITGKGIGGDGILKNQVPRWLNNPGLREYVLSFSYATAPHGGEGALYILIKKRK